MIDQPCPRPGKRAFDSRARALSEALKSSRTLARPMRAYRCRCGKWHLTSSQHPFWWEERNQ